MRLSRLHRRYAILAFAAVLSLAGTLAGLWHLYGLNDRHAQAIQALQAERLLAHRIAELSRAFADSEPAEGRHRRLAAAADRLRRNNHRLLGRGGHTALLQAPRLQTLYRYPPLALGERLDRLAGRAVQLARNSPARAAAPERSLEWAGPDLARLDEDIGVVVFEARRWHRGRSARWGMALAGLVVTALVLWLLTLSLVLTPAMNLSARAEGRLRERDAFLRSLTDEFTDALIVIDERGRMETFNPAAERLFGFAAQEVLGKNVKILMPEPDRSQHDGYLERYRRDGVKRMVGKRREVTGLRKDGSVVELELAVSEHREGPERHFMGVLRDIGEQRRQDQQMNERLLESLMQEVRQRREVQKELTRLANTDRLTGLYNRTVVEERLKQGVEIADRYRTEISLVIMDIDHFKAVNDTHGHVTGDMVLQRVAAVVNENLRGADILARWGGEEFVILAPETGLDAAATLAGRIREALHGHEFEQVGTVTASFGVAAYHAGEGQQSFIERADEALYRAKEEGRDRVCTTG